MTPSELQKFLNAKIPIAQALGTRVLRADAASAEVAARLEPNLNHLGTAFGGSLNAVLVLACYSWIFNQLAEAAVDGHVVIKSSEIRYLAPVAEDFTAICRAPLAAEVERFMKTVKRKSRGQIDLQASITAGGKLACEFHGCFVALAGDISG